MNLTIVKSKMKIAVVGCGAVGSFYGARLCRAGQEVHFLLRSDYDVVRQKGVTIRSSTAIFMFNPAAPGRRTKSACATWS